MVITGKLLPKYDVQLKFRLFCVMQNLPFLPSSYKSSDRKFVLFWNRACNNKPSGLLKHERLKWYTVWRLPIQLLMSKNTTPVAKAVIRGGWGGEEVIKIFPHGDGSWSRRLAHATSKIKFSKRKQCWPNVLQTNLL